MKTLTYILILLSLVSITSCEFTESAETIRADQPNAFKSARDSLRKAQYPQRVQVMVIDSCEYIIWEGSHWEVGYAHKGNCKFCIQRNPCNQASKPTLDTPVVLVDSVEKDYVRLNREIDIINSKLAKVKNKK